MVAQYIYAKAERLILLMDQLVAQHSAGILAIHHLAH
jgi:hypothetical protein